MESNQERDDRLTAGDCQSDTAGLEVTDSVVKDNAPESVDLASPGTDRQSLPSSKSRSFRLPKRKAAERSSLVKRAAQSTIIVGIFLAIFGGTYQVFLERVTLNLFPIKSEVNLPVAMATDVQEHDAADVAVQTGESAEDSDEFELDSSESSSETTEQSSLTATKSHNSAENMTSTSDIPPLTTLSTQTAKGYLYIVRELPTKELYLISGDALGEYKVGDELIAYDELMRDVPLPVALLRVIAIHTDSLTAQAILVHPDRPIRSNYRVDDRLDLLVGSELVPLGQ